MSKKGPLYFIIHKPFQVLSQFTNEDGHLGLGSIFKLPNDVYPVGRLDLDSEGLLILTSDRALNHKLLNPSHEHKRTYWVEVDGEANETALKELQKGVEINLKGKKYKTLPCEARLLGNVHLKEREPSVNRIKHPTTRWIEITLKEGKNRQVRRMTAKIGHPTLRLIRVSIEDLKLGDLKAGEMVQISKNVMYKKLKLDHLT